MTMRRNVDLLEITAIQVKQLNCDYDLSPFTRDEKLIKVFNLRLTMPAIKLLEAHNGDLHR
jgi:hypothetical protein